jgi:hypothetical protein
MPTTVHPSMLTSFTAPAATLKTPMTLHEWVDALIKRGLSEHMSGMFCDTCLSPLQSTACLLQPPPFLHFEIPSEMMNSVLPSQTLIYRTQYAHSKQL